MILPQELFFCKPAEPFKKISNVSSGGSNSKVAEGGPEWANADHLDLPKPSG